MRDATLDALKARVRGPGQPIEIVCADPPGRSAERGCRRTALARVQRRLAAGSDAQPVRVLHLGDSHVAADFITSRIRRDLQERYGDGGRGFVHPDQRWGYGGRLVAKSKRGWIRDRIVDGGRAGRPYGFSGLSLTARRPGVSVWYRVRSEDRRVRLWYGTRRKGRVTAWLDDQMLGRLTLNGPKPYVEFALPDREPRSYRRGPPGNTLRVRADTRGLALYGISFEGDGGGIQYSSIGPVGADAKVYLQLDPTSFARHLKAYRPDLVSLMVGGNDALKIRKGWTTLARVTADHRRLLRLVKNAVPGADCLVWAPMLAGRKKGGKIVSKAFLGEVRDMQRRVATEAGCAFWDTMAAMGGRANTVRWVPALASDLVHPRKSAADLIGRMFVRAWMKLD